MKETTGEKVIRGTAASPRLDALASLGFGVSRNRIVREIKAAKVRLNGAVVTDGAKPVKAGDVISLEGRGDAAVEQLSGPTRKGRIAVTVTRRPARGTPV